jgi:magnesium chelatase family protein
MATQPCPCGYYGDPVKECTCSPSMIIRYRPTPLRYGDFLRSPRISDPLLDGSAQPCAALKTLRSLSLCEVDIHVEVPRVEYDKLADDRLGEPSAAIRERVEDAREGQRERFAGVMGDTSGRLTLLCNADTSALALSRRQDEAAQMQVWAPPRCASIARRALLARACACISPSVRRGCVRP